MARPHHRKKHKEHLRQFQHRGDMKTIDAKSHGSSVFAIVGAVVGLAVLYFATQSNIVWALVGAAGGGVAGYLLGKSIDRSANK